MKKLECLKGVEDILESVLALSNKNILELQVELEKFWEVDATFIRHLKEKYLLADDISIWEIYSYLGTKLYDDSLIHKDAEIMLQCLRSNFKKPISSIAFLMLNVLMLVTNEELRLVPDIFKKLLLVPSCESDFKGAVEGFDDVSALDNYENKLRECLQSGDKVSFAKLSKEYFAYYFENGTIKKLIENNGVTAEELNAIVEGMFLDNQKMVSVPNDVYGKIKEYLSKLLFNDENGLDLISDILAKIESVYVLNNNAYKMIMTSLQSRGLLDGKVDYTLQEVKMKLSMAIKGIEFDVKLLKEFKNSLSLEGVKKPFGGLPRVIMSFAKCNGDKKLKLYLEYLFMTSIKCNGTSKCIFQDDRLKYRYNLEMQMAKLIQEDYSVKGEDKQLFLKLFREYLTNYAFSLEVYVAEQNGSLNDLINNAVQSMSTYIDEWSLFRASLDAKKQSLDNVNKNVNESVSSSVNVIVPKKVNPLEGFIQKGRVVKVMVIDEFACLLQEADISKHLQEEYMKQMVNLQNRLKTEKYQRRVQELREELFTKEEIDLIDKAKISGNMEATQVVKDIEATFDLLLEVNEEEEKQELLVEIKQFMTILSEILNPTVSIDNDFDVVYYKNKADDCEVPKLFTDLNKLKKSESKLVGMELNKILQGNTNGDKEALGMRAPVRIMFKGKSVRVFYALVGNIKVVLGCGIGDKFFQEIRNLSNSKEFLQYLKFLQLQIKNGNLKNDNEWTNVILEKLDSKLHR